MNILVTGATRGIGKCIAENIEGNIFAVGRCEELLKSYKNYLVCDLSKNNDIKNLGNYIQENNIDILINNAGEYIYSKIEDIDYNTVNFEKDKNFQQIKEELNKASNFIDYFLILGVEPNIFKNDWRRLCT